MNLSTLILGVVLFAMCVLGVLAAIVYPGPVYAVCVVLGFVSAGVQWAVAKHTGVPSVTEMFGKRYYIYMLASIALCGLFAVAGFSYPDRGGLILLVYVAAQLLFGLYGFRCLYRS